MNNTKYEKLINGFKNHYKNLIVTSVIDYDDKYIIIEALENTNKKDYNDPYYAVEKKSGDVTHFSPAFDIDKFFDAVENRMIFSSNGGKTNE